MKESKPVIFGSGASSSKDFKSLYINCHAALTNGITHFDTAPSYATEEVLSQAVQRSANELGLKRSDYQIQTKIDPIQMYNGKVYRFFVDSLAGIEVFEPYMGRAGHAERTGIDSKDWYM